MTSPEALAAALGQFPPTTEQSRVISAPLTPTLVVAGAGSGKTETMAGRVVWLVAGGHVERDRVLGLTFTRKAAGELAERIHRRLHRLAEFERRGLVPHLDRLHSEGQLDVFRQIEQAGAGSSARAVVLDSLCALVGGDARGGDDESGGPDFLQRPTVATYNSFADQIVRENAVRSGRDAEASVLSESAAWLLMRRVVLESDDSRLEERQEALSTIVDAALRIARDGVDNRVDFDELARFPEGFNELLERPSTSARVSVYEDVAKATKAVDALALLAELAAEYGRRKRRAGVIDFSDQVAGAYEIVHGHAAVVADLRERHRVVLLDEYQDTSVAQTDLLAEAFRDTAVMAVGDPHQSIYGWRGASAGNLGGFGRAFTSTTQEQQYTLLTSWRNSERVLTAADAVLAPLHESAAVPVEALHSRPGAPRGEVTLRFDRDIETEADTVATWFESLRAQRTRNGETTTGAILFRNKAPMRHFASALAERGIPHRILGLGGLLSTPEVVDVVSALRVMSDPRAGSALIRLLSGPRWSIGVADLRALSLLAGRLSRHDSTLQPLQPDVVERLRSSAGDEQGSLIDALDFIARVPEDHGWLGEITPVGRARLRDAGTVFAGLRRQAGIPVTELIRVIELELRLDIELAANEARGPLRTSSEQLRAFVDEVRGFLASDDRGSLPSLLAWLDHAERVDEFAPRTEPPEDDVVQLLTVHGSKGLEWDAVAVVRLVEGELPGRAKDTKGWLAFGVLPYEFRGDAAWLPALRWREHEAPTQQDLKAAITSFAEANRHRQIEEERRLGYVAVTRARDHLLLTGSRWSHIATPREPSRFLTEIAAALDDPLREQLENAVGEDSAEDDVNPLAGVRRTVTWPIDPLGSRRARVIAAADRVRSVEAGVAEPERDVALLLAEQAAREAPRAARAPVRIPASRFKDYLGDAVAQARSMPERPYRQTRVGTLFHSWVEQRSGLVGAGASLDEELFDDVIFDDSLPADDLTYDVDSGGGAGSDELGQLKERFLASEWGALQPIEVETEIDVAVPDLFGDGAVHVIICKLDAVYRRGERIEIVDWKTGKAPRTASEREERLLQLRLYRQAYHARHGVPLDQIDVALFYVAEGVILRD